MPPKLNPIKPIEGLSQARARPFFNRAVGRAFEIHDADGVTEIDLYDEIGFWGVDARQFRQLIKQANNGGIRLRINSPGGDVFDGIAMFNDLVAYPGNVDVQVTGLAASAASIVAMAGNTITVAANAFLMIHNAWTIMLGDRYEMAATAAVLEQIDGALADTYAARTGVERAEIVDMMDAETWMQGPDAIERGFADQTETLPEPKAQFDLSGFKSPPPAIAKFAPPAQDPTIRDLEMTLTQDAGLSRSKARALLRKGYPAAAKQDAGDNEAEFVAAFQPLLQSLKERASQ